MRNPWILLFISMAMGVLEEKLPDRFYGRFEVDKAMDIHMDEYLKAKGLSWVLRQMVLTCDSTIVFADHGLPKNYFYYEISTCKFVTRYREAHIGWYGADELHMQLVFKLAGEDFEDIRFWMEEWPKHKADMPFGQIPVLEVDGMMIPQSAAIGRYVAKKFGLAGKTPTDQAWVDACVDQFKDHYTEINKWYYTALGFANHGDKESLYKSVYEPARDKFYDFLQKRLKKNGTGFLVGNSATWADLLIADHMHTILQLKPDTLQRFPEMLAFKKRVEELPQIKKWIATRPKTPF